MERPIGIIGAMSIEIETVLKAGQITAAEEHASMRFYTGSYAGVPVVVAECCPGKVNSALCAQVMADRYEPQAILNIGVAGGIGPQVKIGDVVIAEACVQYDCDTTAIGDPLALVSLPRGESSKERVELPCDRFLADRLEAVARKVYGGTVHRGIVATGDTFVADPALGSRLYETFGALACEMEGGSIVHACLLNQIPCGVLRTISDNGNDDAKVDFAAFAEDSARKAQVLLAQVLPEIRRETGR